MWILYVLIVLMMGFAFGIGGERYFGRYRRGLLLFVPISILGLMLNAPWYYYVAQLGLAWVCYQSLFYDECIKLIWPNGSTYNKGWKAVLGYAGLFVNGAITALQPMLLAYLMCGFRVSTLIYQVLLCGLGFIWICRLSNVHHFKFGGEFKVGEVQIWGGEDSWWCACFVFGLVLGVSFMLVLI